MILFNKKIKSKSTHFPTICFSILPIVDLEARAILLRHPRRAVWSQNRNQSRLEYGRTTQPQQDINDSAASLPIDLLQLLILFLNENIIKLS